MNSEKAERNAALVKAYRAGLSQRELAARFGIDQARVSRVISANSRSQTLRRDRQIALEFQQGRSLKFMSEKHSLTPRRVLGIVERAGLSRPRGRPKLYAEAPETRTFYGNLRHQYGAAFAREIVEGERR